MKTKRLERKLVLNKNTVTNLEKQEMKTAKGGATVEPENTCFPCGGISVLISCLGTGCDLCLP